MGHPFVVAANVGYLNDLRDLGFQTFGSLIDETYDQIENGQQRLERVAQTVQDLCAQDLAKFAEQCYNICAHNQQHLALMSRKVREDFAGRFQQFVKEHKFDE
jgi:hypothetical protein